jgi:hypothetical protein
MGDEYIVNGLMLPPLLIRLLEQGKWKHPGHEVVKQVVPSLKGEPVIFLEKVQAMRWESPHQLADEPFNAKIFMAARGSTSAVPIELPWLDVEKAVTIAVCLEIGADVGIQLDYRTGQDDPRVVASDWRREGHFWCEVTPTFSEFTKRIGLT